MSIGLLIALPVCADRVDGIRLASNQTEPIAAVDGVLLIPLDAKRHGDNWPASIPVRFGRGGLVQGDVIWIYAAGRDAEVHWTSPPGGLALRPIRPSDDSSQSNLRPHLVVDVPINASGTLELLGQTIQPVWMEAPLSPVPAIDDDAPFDDNLSIEIAANRPDPNSAFEYWRWVLLASNLNVDAPSPLPGRSDLEQLVATYYADLWRIGLARLAAASEGVARDVRDVLTATVVLDDGTEIAAWMTDADELSYILGLLLDFDRTDESLVRDALAWVDTRDLLFYFAVPDDHGQLRLALVNPTSEERIVTFRWEFVDANRNRAEIAVPAEVPAGRMMEVEIDRPEIEDDQPGPSALIVAVDRREERLQVRPETVRAQPPGVFFGPLLPMKTLAEAQANVQQPADVRIATSATLRKLRGQWELFFECARPDTNATNRASLQSLNSPSQLAGIEAVTVFLIAEGASDSKAAFTVPEHGNVMYWPGGSASGLGIERQSYGDRWYCRVSLPSSVLGDVDVDSVSIGIMRTHAGITAVESSPVAVLPWNIDPGRIRVDLSSWENLPASRTTTPAFGR